MSVTESDIGKMVECWDDLEVGIPSKGELIAIHNGRFIVFYNDDEIISWLNARLMEPPLPDPIQIHDCRGGMPKDYLFVLTCLGMCRRLAGKWLHYNGEEVDECEIRWYAILPTEQ